MLRNSIELPKLVSIPKKKRIRRTLIKLAVKQRGSRGTNRGPCAGSSRGVVDREGSRMLNFELKQRVTWRQVDFIAFARVPAANNQTPRIGIRFDLIDQTRNLIDAVSLRIMPAEGTPEVSVHWPKIARLAAKAPRVLCVRPFLPDVDAARAQIRLISVA